MNSLQLIVESLLLLAIIPNIFSEENDVYYVAEFTDEIRDCDDFENDVFKCNSLTVSHITGDGDEEGKLGLSGKLELLADIIDEYTIDLKVWKETDLSKEFMYAISGNICGTLKKEDTPWWPFVKSLNTSECPIKHGEYPVDNMVLSLDFARGVLRHEFVGEYIIELSIVDQLEKQLSCHILSAGISERTKE
ncbi:unnamed protein product [Euphydryas editha]|uniref:MD-2-related lipid-recognition domain-containing protein n=1 Tax=Euphydryas editha TaxID=104508 RepID=A0AAU9VB66_EUPED|nr:unnamed protein product [Euphydryas editha]